MGSYNINDVVYAKSHPTHKLLDFLPKTWSSSLSLSLSLSTCTANAATVLVFVRYHFLRRELEAKNASGRRDSSQWRESLFRIGDANSADI